MKHLLFALFTPLFIAKSNAANSIDRNAIKKTVQLNKEEIRGCYSKELKSDPSVYGKLVVSWSIDENGRGFDFAEVSNSIWKSSIFDCLTNKMMNWKFEPAPKGLVVKFTYPFVFSPK